MNTFYNIIHYINLFSNCQAGEFFEYNCKYFWAWGNAFFIFDLSAKTKKKYALL